MKANIANLAYFADLHKFRKESKFHSQFSVLDRNTGQEIAIARFYDTETRVYCCLWIHGHKASGSGAGFAGGYGYHKESAALEHAINRAGIKLNETIGGVGEQAIVRALEAVARAVSGKRKFFIVRAHA